MSPVHTLRQRNVPKRKATQLSATPSLRCGQPAVLSFVGVSLNSRRFAALKQTRALIRQNLRSSAHPEGNPQADIHTGRRFARPTPPGRKPRAMRRLGRAQQWPVWLSGCSAAHPLLAAPAAGRLRGGMGAFARMLRDLTRRGCPSAARQRVASSTAHPANAPPQVCPAGVADCRVAFLLGTFLWRSKEQVPRPPGRDPAPALSTSTSTSTSTTATATTYRKLTRTSPPAKSPPRATPRTTPSQSTRPPPSH